MSEHVFKAVVVVGEALKGLAPDEQLKVLDGVVVLLGLDGQRQKPAPGAEASRSPPTPAHKKKSVAEFLKEKRPASIKETIAVFALYRQEIEGFDTFDPRDLAKYFALSRIKSPGKHFRREFDKSVEAGWIHEEGAASYLTQAGEAAIQTFSRAAAVKEL